MAQPTAVGSAVRLRLTDHYSSVLTPGEQAMARRITKRLKYTRTDGKGAKGSIRLADGYKEVHVSNGKLNINGNWYTANKVGATVGETVCEAVHRGWFVDKPDGPTPDPKGRGDGAGEAPGEGRGEGRGEPDGEGKGGGAGEGEGDDAEGAGSGDGDGKGEGKPDAEGDGEEGDGEAEQGEGDEPQPKPDPEKDQHDEDYLVKRLREIHAWLTDSATQVEEVARGDGQGVSNVPYKMGRRMLHAGIPVRGILHAYAMNWPDTMRQAAGIEDYNPATFGSVEGRHELYAYVRALVEVNVPVLLIGPTQSGKSYVLGEIAQDLEIPYRFCPLTAGASSSWLLGSHTPEGFISAPMEHVYTGGGIFNFEEVDAADPNLLLVLNNALSNDVFENPRTGRAMVKHEWFRAAATANTALTGATSEYTGRQRQDSALAERFRMGRVTVPYDQDLQLKIFKDEAARLGPSAGAKADDKDAVAEEVSRLAERLQQVQADMRGGKDA
jgi:MoxR-like ATPase